MLSFDQGRPDELARCLRDVVAMSTLPGLWAGADAKRIAESVAAALFTTLQPALVLVSIEPGDGAEPVSVAQTGRYATDPAIAATLARGVAAWASTHDPDELFVASQADGTVLQLAVRPIGHLAGLGFAAVAMAGGERPTPEQHVVLNVCATQAAVAVRNSQLLGSLRASEEVARHAERGLRESDRRKDEFLATLAHELRNPLAALRNVTHLLQVQAIGGEDFAWGRDVLDRQLRQLSRLVDDLLDISRINRGHINLQRTRTDLVQVVASAAEATRPAIEERGHRLDLDLPAHPVLVDGDAVRLGQVVSNLLQNACRYTEPGGRIDVHVGAQGGRARFRVRDTGIGIAPDALGRVFDMFAQAEHPLTREGGGLGIGLTISRRLVELHGGTIEADSEGPGRGSEFRFDLPLAADAEDASPGDAQDAQPTRITGTHRRVLVADDNRDAAESLAMLLELEGHHVEIAADGVEAVERALVMQPDLVLMDIGMPRLNGYDAARRMRASGTTAASVLVAVTGWGQEVDRRMASDAGFDHHLTKPVEIDALMRLLDECARQVEPTR